MSLPVKVIEWRLEQKMWDSHSQKTLACEYYFVRVQGLAPRKFYNFTL